MAFALSPGPSVSRQIVCHSEGTWRGIKFVLHLLEVFLHSFIAPQLPSDKIPAKATCRVDCMSTDWELYTKRVIWKLKLSFGLFCSSPCMHKTIFPVSPHSPFLAHKGFLEECGFHLFAGHPWPQLAYSIIPGITNMFLSVVTSGCVSGPNCPFIRFFSLWINQHLLRRSRAAWRVIDLLSGILSLSLLSF